MSLLRVTSPHASGHKQVSLVMRDVLLATLPGVAVMTWYFGPGTLINLALGAAVALASEYLATTLRGQDPRAALDDLSVLVTSTLLCIALPPYAPWWLIVIGVLTAVLLGKQVFGGLGYNPFNPAMVGYVVLLISFPVQMSSWAPPRGLETVPTFGEALQHVFSPGAIDAMTAATPLDLLRQNTGQLFDDLMTTRPEFSSWGGLGWFEVNLAFLLGGLWLLYRKVFTWHAPMLRQPIPRLMEIAWPWSISCSRFMGSWWSGWLVWLLSGWQQVLFMAFSTPTTCRSRVKVLTTDRLPF